MSDGCGHESCKAAEVAQEVMTLLAKNNLSIHEAAIVARDIGYSVLMQCPAEHKIELGRWIVAGIEKAVEQ